MLTGGSILQRPRLFSSHRSVLTTRSVTCFPCPTRFLNLALNSAIPLPLPATQRPSRWTSIPLICTTNCSSPRFPGTSPVNRQLDRTYRPQRRTLSLTVPRGRPTDEPDRRLAAAIHFDMHEQATAQGRARPDAQQGASSASFIVRSSRLTFSRINPAFDLPHPSLFASEFA